MKTNVQQARPVNGYHRRTLRRPQAAAISPRVTLPPMEAFAGAPVELIDALSEWHALGAQGREYRRKQRAALDAADRAAADYREGVKAAIAKGTDPAKVKDKTEQHKAEAAAHAEYATAAESAQVRTGIVLGPLLERHAPSLYAPAETAMAEAAAEVQDALGALTSTWARWSAAFAVRRWLSTVAMDGRVTNYHGPDRLPPEVAAALDTLADHLAELDRLKSDEAEVQAFRKANA